MKRRRTISRKLHPARFQRRCLRNVQGKSPPVSDVNDLVLIKLKDLGYTDVKVPNKIPRSIGEKKLAAWRKGLDMKENNACFPFPNSLLKINSRLFCPICSSQLLNICGNDSESDSCCHMWKNKSCLGSEVNNLLNSLDINKSSGNESVIETMKPRKNCSKERCERAVIPEEEIKCSTSELSMRTQMCTSQSTVSSVISESVQVSLPQEVPNKNVVLQDGDRSKFEVLCGELLLQLCKVVVGNSLVKEAAVQTMTPCTTNFREAPNNSTGFINSILPGARNQSIQREGFQNSHDKNEQTELNLERKTTGTKTTTKCFEPLLCTRLTVPWNCKQSYDQFAMPIRPRDKAILKNGNSTTSVIAKDMSSQIVIDYSKPQDAETLPNEIQNVDRNKSPISKQKCVKRQNKKIEKPEVCSNCGNINNLIYGSNPVVKIKTTSGKREREYQRNSKKHSTLPKERRSKRHSKTENDKLPKDNATKYFIKSFFAGTSSEATPTTKSFDKTHETSIMRHNARRKKSNFTIIHHDIVDEVGSDFTKKFLENDNDRKILEKILRKYNADLSKSKERTSTNKQVKVHEKQRKASSSLFHTCLNHILTSNSIERAVCESKHLRPPKGSFHPKKSKGTKHTPTSPHKLEKHKFNDSLFSCFIPKVFK